MKESKNRWRRIRSFQRALQVFPEVCSDPFVRPRNSSASFPWDSCVKRSRIRERPEEKRSWNIPGILNSRRTSRKRHARKNGFSTGKLFDLKIQGVSKIVRYFWNDLYGNFVQRRMTRNFSIAATFQPRLRDRRTKSWKRGTSLNSRLLERARGSEDRFPARTGRS